MVNQVSFTGANNLYRTQDIKNLANYVTGRTIINNPTNPIADGSMMLGFGLVTEIPTIWKWGKTARVAGGGAGIIPTLKKENLRLKRQVQVKTGRLIKSGGLKKADTYIDALNTQRAKELQKLLPKEGHLTALAEAGKTSQNAQYAHKAYKNASTLLEEAIANPANAGARIKAASIELTNASALAHGEVKATSFFGKAIQGFKKFTGISFGSGVVKKLATKSPTALGNVLHIAKGNALFTAIEGGIQVFTNIIPTFVKLGPVAGVKQIFKSSLKVAGSVGGWAAGAAAGAAIGEMIFPPGGGLVGGLIGAAIGLAGGFAGSAVGTKVAGAIAGKDELELDKERQAEALSKEAQYNPAVAMSLVASATKKLQEEGADSEESKVVADSLQKVSSAAGSQTSTPSATDSNPFAQMPGAESMDMNPYFLAYQNALQKNGGMA